MTPRRTLLAVAGLCAISLLGELPASATPVTYSLTGTFSGSLNGVSFANQQGTFLLSSDTSSVLDLNYAFFNSDGTSTFQLGSATPVSFLSSSFGVESEYGAASFMDASKNFAVGELNEFTPHDVLTVANQTTGSFGSYGAYPASTSGGDLILTGATGDLVFQTADITAAPEPSSIWLAVTGLAGTAAGLRRKLRF